MTDDPRTAEAYQSALDLPSFRNLLQQIQAAKLLTRLVARDKRRDLIRLEKEIRVMASGWTASMESSARGTGSSTRVYLPTRSMFSSAFRQGTRNGRSSHSTPIRSCSDRLSA
jgi:hypothetical protein